MTLPTHGIDHLLVAQRTDGRGWSNLYRIDGTWHEHTTRTNGLVRPAIDVLVDGIKLNPDADATFSTRSIAEIALDPVIEFADDLRSYVPGGSIEVFLPERDLRSDLWTQLWRDPRVGLHGGGKEVKFRLPTLADQVEAYFAREAIKSFEPISRTDGQPNVPPMNRPSGFARELLIRRHWSLAEILPDAVPKAFVHRWTKAEEIEMEGKRRAAHNMRMARAKLEMQLKDDARVKAHNERIERANQRPTFSRADLAMIKGE